jgi:homoserine O-succinyltransferase
LREINTRFDVPHSRHNDISRAQLEREHLTVLVESEEGGVHMAVSPDQFRIIYLQGHPEYDTNSLLKEYKREVLRYLNGELYEAPPFPAHYFPEEAAGIAERFVQKAERALWEDQPLPDFLEKEIGPKLDNTWGDTAKAIVANWLGLVYQLTNLDRRKQYMEEVDPDNPLKLK